MFQKTYTTLEGDINPVISYTPEEFLEEKSLNLLEPEEESHTYLTLEQVFQSKETRELFTGTYEFFTNPHSVITQQHIQILYHYLYGPEFNWHPPLDEANNWDSEWSQISDSTQQLRPGSWKV